ncbi:hypothetical protein NLG97_g9755 [Lecanicillium saksenae]|uniref:Uncharacterized protein n=1 Tax=Lecanicillium saksenae TaxID=468837 RepID=A0ACC1QFB1_9HYPO|nr:hypothetical protein NLG97_g9755 [Lecanicillium saksenae]
MDGQFHLFPSLPPELRLHIWSLAVMDRENTAGANFFTIYHRASHSWKHHKGSYSLADSGLWEACHDSRDMMKRMETQLCSKSSPLVTLSHLGRVPMTAIVTDHCGETRRFTVLPGEDLFVFDLGEYFEASLDFPCFVESITTRTGRGRLDLCRNVAFELDESWFEFTRGHQIDYESLLMVEFVIRAALEMRSNSTIYLIDYALRPRAKDVQPSGAVFQTTRGRFVEFVNEKEWGFDVDDNPLDLRRFYGALYFICVVNREIFMRANSPPGRPEYANVALLGWAPN